MFRIHGPFLFGSTDKLEELETQVPNLPPVVILRLRNMTAIDGTGLHALEHFADVLHASGRTLLLCGMRNQPARMMQRADFHEHLGKDNILPTVREAFARAQVLAHERESSAPAHQALSGVAAPHHPS
jgi:SulP family sulfate permease